MAVSCKWFYDNCYLADVTSRKCLVNDFISMAMIGSSETMEQKIQMLMKHPQADEPFFTCDLYEYQDRVRSFDIVAGLQG